MSVNSFGHEKTNHVTSGLIASLVYTCPVQAVLILVYFQSALKENMNFCPTSEGQVTYLAVDGWTHMPRKSFVKQLIKRARAIASSVSLDIHDVNEEDIDDMLMLYHPYISNACVHRPNI